MQVFKNVSENVPPKHLTCNENSRGKYGFYTHLRIFTQVLLRLLPPLPPKPHPHLYSLLIYTPCPRLGRTCRAHANTPSFYIVKIGTLCLLPSPLCGEMVGRELKHCKTQCFWHLHFWRAFPAPTSKVRRIPVPSKCSDCLQMPPKYCFWVWCCP